MTQVIFIGVLLATPSSAQPTAIAAPVVTIAAMASRRSICPVDGLSEVIPGSMRVGRQEHFVRAQTMNVPSDRKAGIAFHHPALQLRRFPFSPEIRAVSDAVDERASVRAV